MEKANQAEETVRSTDLPSKIPDSNGLINASGHRQELDRNFRLINICGLGITTGNTWIALGGSIVCKLSVLLFLGKRRSWLLDCRNLQWRIARCHLRIVCSQPFAPCYLLT